MNAPKGVTIRSTVAGSALGRTGVSTGTITRARPNPTEPCTTAPPARRRTRPGTPSTPCFDRAGKPGPCCRRVAMQLPIFSSSSLVDFLRGEHSLVAGQNSALALHRNYKRIQGKVVCSKPLLLLLVSNPDFGAKPSALHSELELHQPHTDVPGREAAPQPLKVYRPSTTIQRSSRSEYEF
jgi:hypothetical protein